MNRDEALKMLRAGRIKKWNEYREENPEWLPRLSNHGHRANLRGADLRGANLREANLREANLRGADLCEADLSEASLSGAKLRMANLTWADLRSAAFLGADLHRADLTGAKLSRANLNDANLSGADLSEADLSGVVLVGADLHRANLSDAYFRGAQVGNTSFANVDLSEVLDLAEVQHFGTSTIGIDTVLKSNGKIPDEFLRGCGVPDIWIENIRSMIGTMEPIQTFSCFISYSHEDEEFCKRLHSRMRDERMRVWFAQEDLKPGRKLHEQVFEWIDACDKLLLVLSEHSMNSDWVEVEIRRARKREVEERRQILFPLRLCDFKTIKEWECFDADRKKDLAVEIREYYMPDDFVDWKDHDAFEAAFGKLLDALKVEAPAPGPDSEGE